MSKQNCELTLTHRGACLKVFKKTEHDQDWENISEVIMEAILEYNIDIIFNKRLYFTEEGQVAIQNFNRKLSNYLDEYSELKDELEVNPIDLSRVLKLIKRVQCSCGKVIEVS